jgi:hypothetical protein
VLLFEEWEQFVLLPVQQHMMLSLIRLVLAAAVVVAGTQSLFAKTVGPVVIWSVNPGGGPSLASALQEEQSKPDSAVVAPESEPTKTN